MSICGWSRCKTPNHGTTFVLESYNLLQTQVRKYKSNDSQTRRLPIEMDEVQRPNLHMNRHPQQNTMSELKTRKNLWKVYIATRSLHMESKNFNHWHLRVAQFVGQGLNIIRPKLVFIHQYCVVSRPSCALQSRQTYILIVVTLTALLKGLNSNDNWNSRKAIQCRPQIEFSSYEFCTLR